MLPYLVEVRGITKYRSCVLCVMMILSIFLYRFSYSVCIPVFYICFLCVVDFFVADRLGF